MDKLKVFFGTFFLTLAIGATAQVSIHSMEDTWNDAGSTFNAIKMDVTDTASQADSKLLNLQVGSVTQFAVDKSGNVTYTGTHPGVWPVYDDTDFNYGAGTGALDSLTASSGLNNVAIGYQAGNTITTGSYNIILGGNATDVSGATVSDEIAIGHGNVGGTYVPNIHGSLSARTDADWSTKTMTVSGPSALPAAVTNQDGGDLILQGGQSASGGGDNGLTLVNDTVYGIMSVQAGATSQDDIGTTPEILTAWNTDGIANGTTPSQANDYITALVAGVYEVHANLSFSGTSSSVVDMEIYVYDDSGTSWSASGFQLQRKIGTGGDVGNAGTSGLVTLDTDDRVAIYVATDGATDDVTVTEAQLQIKRISN
jgi:hypothetical protein